jgi:hypothetical protein
MLTPCDLLKRTPWFVVILPFSGFQGGSTGSNPVGGAGKTAENAGRDGPQPAPFLGNVPLSNVLPLR